MMDPLPLIGLIGNLNALGEQLLALKTKANLLAVGKKVRILSDFNGQPYGKSRKSLCGDVFTIGAVYLESTGRVSLFLNDSRNLACVGINEVEEVLETTPFDSDPNAGDS